MTLLMWEKPDQVLPKEVWMNISADGAPPGVYSPNMSRADMERYKAKLVGKHTDEARVEIRKTFGGTQMLILVTLLDSGLSIGKNKIAHSWGVTYDIAPDKTIRISMNGPAHLSFAELGDIIQAVAEARTVLRLQAEGKQS